MLIIVVSWRLSAWWRQLMAEGYRVKFLHRKVEMKEYGGSVDEIRILQGKKDVTDSAQFITMSGLFVYFHIKGVGYKIQAFEGPMLPPSICRECNKDPCSAIDCGDVVVSILQEMWTRQGPMTPNQIGYYARQSAANRLKIGVTDLPYCVEYFIKHNLNAT